MYKDYLEPFFESAELEELQSYEEKKRAIYDRLESYRRKTLEIIRAGGGGKLIDVDREEAQLLEELEPLVDKANEISRRAYDRLRESYAADPERVFDDIEKAVQGITKQDYIQQQKEQNKTITLSIEEWKEELANLQAEKEMCEERKQPFQHAKALKELKKKIRTHEDMTKQGYRNCLHFIWGWVSPLSWVVYDYHLDVRRLQRIISSRAADFYKPPKDAKTTQDEIREKDERKAKDKKSWISMLEDPHQSDLIESGDNFIYDSIARAQTFKSDNGYTTIKIFNIDEPLHMTAETAKVMDMIAGKFHFQAESRIELDEFIALLPPEKAKTRWYAREKLAGACDFTSSIFISGQKKKNGKMVKENGYHICSWEWMDGNHNTIRIVYDPMFIEKAAELTSAPFPASLPTKTGKAYLLGRKLIRNKHLNTNEQNENIISVKALLKSSGIKVSEKDKHINRDVIEPFERYMDELSDLLSWEYCGKNGAPLPDEELENKTKYFFSWNIRAHFVDYPMEADVKRKQTIKHYSKKRNKKTKQKE